MSWSTAAKTRLLVSTDGANAWFKTRADALLTMRTYFPSDAANAVPSRMPSS